MATLGIEQITENAIRAVARDCGSLSIECSDVAGYVEGVAERIVEHQKVLDTIDQKLLPAAKTEDLVSGLKKMRDTVESHLKEAKSIQADLTKTASK